MKRILIDKYKEEVKKKVETGISIYTKGQRRTIVALLILLCASALVLVIYSLIECYWNLYGQNLEAKTGATRQELTLLVEDFSKVSTDDGYSEALSEREVAILSQYEPENWDNTVGTINYALTEMNRMEKHARIFMLSSFAAMLITLLALYILERCAIKKASNDLDTMLHNKFAVLRDVLKSLYYTDDSKEKVEEIDKEKIDELICIYSTSLEEAKEEKNSGKKVLVTFLSAVGTIISVSLANLDKLGMGVEDWAIMVAVILFIAIVVYFVMTVVYEFDSTISNYKYMLDILHQYKVFIVEDDKKEKEIDSSQEKTVSVKSIAEPIKVQGYLRVMGQSDNMKTKKQRSIWGKLMELIR